MLVATVMPPTVTSGGRFTLATRDPPLCDRPAPDRHLLHGRDEGRLLGRDAPAEIGVDPGEVGGVGELVVEPGPHLGRERLLLGPGVGQR